MSLISSGYSTPLKSSYAWANLPWLMQISASLTLELKSLGLVLRILLRMIYCFCRSCLF